MLVKKDKVLPKFSAKTSYTGVLNIENEKKVSMKKVLPLQTYALLLMLLDISQSQKTVFILSRIYHEFHACITFATGERDLYLCAGKKY